MHQNNCTVDQLLKASGTNYYSCEYLWKKAPETKHILLNEIHTVFVQEVRRQWPQVPSGTTTLDPLRLKLLTKLWTKKAEELKNARIVRANIMVQEALEVHGKLECMLRDSDIL